MYQQPHHSWHSDTMEKFKHLDIEALRYIRDDAKAAAIAGDGWNPKAGQYWDEFHYACMEIKRRADSKKS